MFKQGDTERVLENMKRGDDIEALLNEIHHGQKSLNLRHRRLLMGTGVSLQPESSPLSSNPFSGEFCFPDDGLFRYTLPQETKYQTQNIHSRNGLWVDSESPDSHVNDLSEHFYGMNVRSEKKASLKMYPLRNQSDDPDEFRFGHPSPSNVVNRSARENGRYLSYHYGVSTPSSDHMNYWGHTMGNSLGTNPCENQSNALYHDSGYCQNRVNYCTGRTKEQGSSYSQREMQLQNALYFSQQNGVDSSTDKRIPNSRNLMNTEMALSFNHDSPLHRHSRPDKRTGVMQGTEGIPLKLRTKKGGGDLKAFSGYEKSLIVQERSLNYVVNEKADPFRGHRKNSLYGIALQKLSEKSSKNDIPFMPGGIGPSPKSYFPEVLQPNSSSLDEFQGCIYFIAKDQNGCRFLQRIFEEGTLRDMEVIFKEIIDHISELMMNPFGNYLVQKLLEACSEEQRMQIVHMVTKTPGELVRISLNMHGTRSVQKLIETLKGQKQISLVIAALEPGFLDLIKDLNGNHVVQRCLQCLSNEDNKFIFNAAAKFCVDIAIHCHGCCVLQQCIAHSTGEHQEELVRQISANGLLLAQDPFGNYVVQYIIEQKIMPAAASLTAQFKGNYVQLSTQKFSSHVVEKCLKHIEKSRSQIIHELLSLPHFEQLLQDPFANYVIQSALVFTKGALRALLAEAVRPHTTLRTSPYCKRIFSQNLAKK